MHRYSKKQTANLDWVNNYFSRVQYYSESVFFFFRAYFLGNYCLGLGRSN